MSGREINPIVFSTDEDALELKHGPKDMDEIVELPEVSVSFVGTATNPVLSSFAYPLLPIPVVVGGA